MGRLSTLRINDPVLQKIAFDYKFPANVGFHLFPVVTHGVSAGKIPVFGKEDFVIDDSRRALGARSNRDTKTVDTVDFVMDEYSRESAIDDREVQNATDIVKRKLLIGKQRVKGLQNKIGLEVEFKQADMAQKTSTYATGNNTTLSGTDQFNDYDNSDPITVIEDGKSTIRKKIGIEPNTCLIAYDVWQILKRHPKLLKEVAVTEDQILTVERIKKLLEIEKIIIAKSVYAKTKKSDFSDIWTKSIVLAYTPNNPQTVDEPSFGYTLRNSSSPKVEKYRDPSAKSEIISYSDELVPAIVGKVAGFLIKDVISG